LGHVNPGGSQSFVCTTGVLQENIIRSGITLSEVSKNGFQYFSFNASVVAGGTATSSFTITIDMNMPSDGCKLSYFLLVIKAQATVEMIDLVSWSKKYIIKRLGPWDCSRHIIKSKQDNLANLKSDKPHYLLIRHRSGLQAPC
jgi:hypothetical protein